MGMLQGTLEADERQVYHVELMKTNKWWVWGRKRVPQCESLPGWLLHSAAEIKTLWCPHVQSLVLGMMGRTHIKLLIAL